MGDSPDPVFRDEILGQGISLDPIDDVVLAPFDSHVISMTESNHAIGLKADNGAEILIHVGIDTVQLKGEGFTAHVQPGERVAQGQPLISFDMDVLFERAQSLRTPVLLLKSDDYQISKLADVGRVNAGDPLFEIHARESSHLAAEPEVGISAGSISKDIIVGLSDGVHARPAGLLVNAIKDFDAKVACGVDADSLINARSATALMGLGIKQGTRLTIQAQGADAAQAVAALESVLEPKKESVHSNPKQENVSQVRQLEDGAVVHAQAAGPGLAIGKSFLLTALDENSVLTDKPSANSVDAELTVLDDAVDVVADYLEQLASSQEGAARDVAQAHSVLLNDPAIIDAARGRIANGEPASKAWYQAIEQVASLWQHANDKRLNERVDDLHDVRARVLRVLSGQSPSDKIVFDQNTVLIAETLLPSQLIELEQANLVAICTAAGGSTSHVSILAASMGIPMLVAVGNDLLSIDDDRLLAVDGDFGELHVQPSEQTLAGFKQRISESNELLLNADKGVERDCLTADQQRIRINANIGSVKDAEAAAKNGAEGCGLLRTEFVFMDRASAPSAEDQRQIYQAISNALGDRPMVIRTLDAGGDKPISYINHAYEENPALGVRGIRLSMCNQALLETQVNAVLQLNSIHVLRLMIPMVTSVSDVQYVRDLVQRIAAEQNLEHQPLIGVMIETPAAALIADQLAQVADFFSIGTNDLTQYTLAMDRGEPSLAASFDTLHPGVLRLIKQVVDAADSNNTPVAVCGGAAGDLLVAPILIGLGVRELSMIPNAIRRQKSQIGSMTLTDCQVLARSAMLMTSAKEVRAMMRNAMIKKVES